MKTNIKMRVTKEQHDKIMKIVFEARGRTFTPDNDYDSLLYISSDKTTMRYTSDAMFRKGTSEEVDPELFIRTNGTCEERTNEHIIRDRIIDFHENGKESILDADKILIDPTCPTNWGFEKNDKIQLHALRKNVVIVGLLKVNNSWYAAEWNKFNGALVYCSSSIPTKSYDLTPKQKEWYEDESNFPAYAFQLQQIGDTDEYNEHPIVFATKESFDRFAGDYRLPSKDEIESLHYEGK